MTAGQVCVIIETMLTKNDLKQIEKTILRPFEARNEKQHRGIVRELKSAIDKSIKNAFAEFFETISALYVEKNEGEHREMIGEIRALRKDTDEIRDYVKDHDKRIDHLETASSVKN